MATVTVTVDQFIERFPSFDGQDELIEVLLPEAAARVGDTWSDEDQKRAIQYLTAHMIVKEGDADSLPVISESLGPISTSYAFDPKTNPLLTTEYGRRYVEIRNRNGGGTGASILVVGGGSCPPRCV